MHTVGTLRRAAAVLWSLVLTWAIAALVAARLAPRARRLLSARLARSTTDALGLRMRVTGAVPTGDDRPRLYVANHVSWLDIYALGAWWPARFVAKMETASWPLAGTIARRFDALFIVRGSFRDAARVKARVAAALAAGDSVVVFPEGDDDRTAPDSSASIPRSSRPPSRPAPSCSPSRSATGSPTDPPAPPRRSSATTPSRRRSAACCASRRSRWTSTSAPALSPAGWTRRELAARSQTAVAGALGLHPAVVKPPYPLRPRRIAPAA
jgi:1-acyl-sn-glycerol-3-phosphate acyltransferase